MTCSIAQRVRHYLAALLVGLLMLASAEPCAAFVAAPTSHAAIAAPPDPCKTYHRAAPSACVQLSCQHFAVPASGCPARVEAPAPAVFAVLIAATLGRSDAPPLPPPRLR